MIERISGKLLEKSPTYCVIDCHGIGLGVHVSVNTFQHLEKFRSSDQVQLFTHLHVREDLMQLYGFFDEAEKEMFRLLISISGVGPRLAIAVLSGSSVEELRDAIAREDVDMLTRIPGVGRKTAQRLILELNEKIRRRQDLVAASGGLHANAGQREQLNEALLALLSLGYKEADARRALSKIMENHAAAPGLEEIIKLALREI